MNLKTEHDGLANTIAKVSLFRFISFSKKIDFKCFIRFSDFFFNSLLVNIEDKNFS